MYVTLWASDPNTDSETLTGLSHNLDLKNPRQRRRYRRRHIRPRVTVSRGKDTGDGYFGGDAGEY